MGREERSVWYKRLLIIFLIIAIAAPLIAMGPLMPVWERMVADDPTASWAPTLLRYLAFTYHYTMRPVDAERCFVALVQGGPMGSENKVVGPYVIDVDYDGEAVLYEYAECVEINHQTDKRRIHEIYSWWEERYPNSPDYEMVHRKVLQLEYGTGGIR